MCPSVSWRGSSGALLPPAALSPFRCTQHSIPIRRKQKHKHSGSSVQQSLDYSESSNILIRALQPVLASVRAGWQSRWQCSARLIATSQQLFEALSPKSKRACHCLWLGFAGIADQQAFPIKKLLRMQTYRGAHVVQQAAGCDGVGHCWAWT